MSAYQPQPGVWPGRPPCSSCGAAYRLHRPAVGELPPDGVVPIDGRPYLTQAGRDALVRAGAWLCPEAYRPSTLEVAQRELAEAEAAGDEARVFVARGEVQRLTGRGTKIGG